MSQRKRKKYKGIDGIKCPLFCFCHSKDWQKFNNGELLPAFDCCEHCCPLYKIHNEDITIIKISVREGTYNLLKKAIEADRTLSPTDRNLFNHENRIPAKWIREMAENILNEYEG